jgi:hypothetical protein
MTRQLRRPASGVVGCAGTGRNPDVHVQPFRDEEVRRADFCDAPRFSLPEIYFRSKVFSKPALAPGATILCLSGWITET